MAQAFGVLAFQVVFAQLLVHRTPLEDVIDDPQQRMPHRHQSALLPPTAGQPPVLARQGRTPLALGRPGGLRQSGSQPAIPLPRTPTAAFTGALIIPWTHPRPRG